MAVIEPERQDDDVRRDEIERMLTVFEKKRAKFVLEIEVDLDPVPGRFDKVDDFIEIVIGQVKLTMPHYNPVVTVQNAGGEDVKCPVVAQASKADEEEPYCCQIGACRASGGSD